MLHSLIAVVVVAATAHASPAANYFRDRNVTAICQGLANKASTLIPGYPAEIYAAQVYPTGTTFVDPVHGSASHPLPAPNLVEFCRFGAYFNTSSSSRVQFEIWLPTQTWNKRFAFVGNGGDAGGVNFHDMGVPLSKYGFAVASTDNGHNGAIDDGTFAINNPQTQTDFGYRAVHLSTVFSKNVVKAFYSKSQKSSYWIGCSSGGRQGLKEVQSYPKDYDGVLFGSPAYYWSHLNGWTIQSNLINAPTKSGYIDPPTWLTIHDNIISQCDKLDGLEDQLITNPELCKPNFAAMPITKDQQNVAKRIYQSWTDSNGKFLFPGFSPGSEYAAPQFVNGVPFKPAPDYFKYQVLNLTSVDDNVQFTEKQLIKLTKEADKTNPGQTTTTNFNIAPFLKRGGKLLGYVGTADPLIPYGSSIYFYDRVVKKLGYDPRESFRLFTVPGMGHCGGGNVSPSAFGQAGQFDIAQGGILQSSDFDADHDAILALIEWTEKGKAPDQIIATSYVSQAKPLGIDFQRPICPYPQFAKYVSGDTKQASSFKCV